uniref:Uncharacterized protein n=1 Tax=Sander lucioperca TaxID=283035 RepID=A0A8C9YGH5_SANLU
MVALEHLKELDKQLKEEGIAFSPEASLHLTEITAAITDLEAERRAAHEHLEVETIENSKLRHQINNLRERMSQEIMADVVEARASNAEEIEQLRKDLHAVSQLREATAKRQVALLSQNEALSPEREQVKAEHEGIVAAQNDRIALKYSLQMHLDQTRDRIEELKSCTAAVQQDKIMLQRKMVLEREAFAVKNDRLSGEVEQAEEKIKQQKLVNRRSRIVLDSLNEKKRETHNQLGELMIDMAKLESQIRRLAADRLQCEKQLQKEEILKEVEANWNEERSRHQGLKTLTSELKRKKSDLELSIQGLKEKTDSLLQPKDQTKAELDEMRRGYMDVLRQQASELRAVEMSIYDNSVKLEQVRMENSRLHLCIQQMTEDVGAARENKERYWQEVGQLQRDIRALCESLEEAWREDLVVTQERQNSDGVLLASMGAMLNHLKTRRQQLGNVGTLLHQQISQQQGDDIKSCLLSCFCFF